ncbi:Plasmodium exported protein, unknown function, partial [Plasmodium vivax]
KGLENICNSKDSIYIEAYRLLAKQDLKMGLYDKNLEDNLLKHSDNGILKFDNYGSSVYDKLQKSCSNGLKIYKKQFKHKYSRKKGLKRLDCYCEKKIFDMIDILGEQPVGTSGNNGIRFIVMCLISYFNVFNYGSSVYDKLQKSCSNGLKIYKKQFKHKYSRKKGLKRLDCYCEKKIFDMIDILGEQPVGTSGNNIKLKKNIVRKLGIRAILMCLVPLIGIILPILDEIKGSSSNTILKESGIPKPVYIIYGIIFIILTYIILFSIIYTMTKVVKYHRLEAGRGKLNFREYCLFCKDIFYA